MNFLLTNWKTTLAGIAAIAAAVIHQYGIAVPDWAAPVIAALGLFAARDADKTSEQSGAK